MAAIIHEYGLMILGCIGTVLVIGIFTVLMAGPVAERILEWADCFL